MLFAVLCVMLQPSILLYDRMVMNAAAAEGCRMLATASAPAGVDEARCLAMVKRHLGAVPPVGIFHVHNPSCSWDIKLSGDEASSQVQVFIATRVQLLPFARLGARAAGLADREGCMTISVACSQATQPPWAGTPDPGGWASARS